MQDAIPYPHHVVEDMKAQICYELDIAIEAIESVVARIEAPEYEVLEAIQMLGMDEPGLIQAYLDGECTLDSDWCAA